MKTGIVIEITGKDAIVMKNGGEFITLPAKEGWKKEISSLNRRKRPAVPIRTSWRRPAPVCALQYPEAGTTITMHRRL